MKVLKKIDHPLLTTLFTLAFVLTPFLFSLHVQHEEDDPHNCTLCLAVHHFQADLTSAPCPLSVSQVPTSTLVHGEIELHSFLPASDQPIRAPPIPS